MILPSDRPPSEEPRREIVLVAGMHRSGTSAFTRVCNLLGAALPEPLVEPAVGNELGHWEPAEVVAMNDRALLASGGEVNSVFPVSPAWLRSRAAQAFIDEVEAYVRGLGQEPRTWFIKDPRISVLADLWREGVRRSGAQPRFILAFRNPWEVAASLCVRQLRYFPDEVWPIERGLALWLNYTLAVERKSRGCPRSFVGYEGVLGDWRAEISRVYDQLGLAPPLPDDAAQAEIEAFLQPSERHARHDALRTRAGLAMRVYGLLQERIADPDGGAGAFDKALQSFNGSFDVLGGYMGALEGRAAAIAGFRADAEAAWLEADAQKLAAETAELRMMHWARLSAGQPQAPLAPDPAAPAAFDLLKAKHEALKAAHRENLGAFKVEQARLEVEQELWRSEQSELWRARLETAREENDAKAAAEKLGHEAAQDENRAIAHAQRLEHEGVLRERDLRDEQRDQRDRDRDAAFQALTAEMALELRQKREAIAAGAAALVAAQSHAHAAQTDLSHVKAEIEALRRSRSWRISAPIRAIVGLLERR